MNTGMRGRGGGSGYRTDSVFRNNSPEKTKTLQRRRRRKRENILSEGDA